MKKLMFILIWTNLCTATVTPKFEFGAMVGDPVGVSTKWWYDTRSAFDLTVGWTFPNNGRLSINFDYLLHLFRIKYANGELPFYTGIGLILRVKDESFWGARIPIGATYLLLKAPLSFFGEVAPHVEIIPETEWGADGGIGIRLTF